MKQKISVTGRTLDEPVLQNTPLRTETARKLRAVFETHWPRITAAHDAIPRYRTSILDNVGAVGAELLGTRKVDEK